jgi:uroporphyrinogen-III decarboxylase
MKIELLFQFAPSWWHRQCGISFDESYHRDPEQRLIANESIWRAFRDMFPQFAAEELFFPAGPAINLQPVVIFLAVCGADVRYFSDHDPWAAGPLVKSMEEMAAFEPVELGSSRFLKDIEAQFDYLAGRFPAERIEVFGKQNEAIIHSTLTVAYKMAGSNLFLWMQDEPALVHEFMGKIHSMNMDLVDFFSAKRRKRPKHIFFGDCVASLFSPRLYAEFGTRCKTNAVRRFRATCAIHSCGPSTHLLAQFVGVPKLQWMELGWGSDWRGAKRVILNAGLERMDALLDPAALMRWSEQELVEEIGDLIRIATPLALTIRTGAIDHGTPMENLCALRDTVEQFRRN